MAEISIRKKPSFLLIVATAILAIILGLVWTGNSSLENRVVTLRYFLFVIIGLSALMPPYLLFPDKNMPLIQLGNLGKSALNRYIFWKFSSYCWPLFLLTAVMLFGDLKQPFQHFGIKLTYLFSSWLLFSAIVMLSATRYIKSGEASQFWKESQKGREMRQTFADYLKYPIDPGSIPSLINTLIVLILGSAFVVSAIYLGEIIHPVAEVFVSVSFVIFSVQYLLRHSGDSVRNFYLSNSFFREFFGVNLKGEEVGVVREVAQLWWVPPFLRVHVWQFLIQLDRIIPAGRVVAAGHFVILFIAYQRPDPQFLLIAWVIFALLHHLFILITYRHDVAPQWLLRWIAPSYTWFLSRFWMQLRWLLPLILGINIQYFLFGTPGVYEQSAVVLSYLVSGILLCLPGISNMFHEVRNGL